MPAGFNRIFGFRTTPGFFSTNGAFPLALHPDTPGLLTCSARGAALAVAGLMGLPEAHVDPVQSLRFGVPREYFFDHLDPTVEAQITGRWKRCPRLDVV